MEWGSRSGSEGSEHGLGNPMASPEPAIAKLANGRALQKTSESQNVGLPSRLRPPVFTELAVTSAVLSGQNQEVSIPRQVLKNALHSM